MVLLLTSLNPKHIFDEKILLESKTRYLPVPIKLVLQIARPFKKFSFVFSFVLLLVFLCSCQGTMLYIFLSVGKSGGLKWTRTIDLALIRRAL